ncbi:MAG: OB-fold nucleic acid binding domain-containing protein, partial [Candidatus Saccharimonas aalborgensis]
MATLKELRDERLRKLDDLKKLGVNAYPAESARTHTCREVAEQFESLEGQTVKVVGRLIGTRKFGKLAFLVLRDMSGQVQLFLKADTIEPLNAPLSQLGMDELNLLDPGDFVEAEGVVIRTQTGEVSVDVRKFRLLTKSLRPMPTEQEGFRDKEERFRRRYV